MEGAKKGLSKMGKRRGKDDELAGKRSTARNQGSARKMLFCQFRFPCPCRKAARIKSLGIEVVKTGHLLLPS